MDTISRSIAYVLMTAGLLRVTNIVEFSTITQLGFALSAFFITLGDFDEFRYNLLRLINKNFKQIEHKKKLVKSVSIFHYLSIASLIIIPNLNLGKIAEYKPIQGFFSWYITNINDSITLLALGLAMFLITLKRDYGSIETRRLQIAEQKEQIEKIDQLKEQIRTLITEVDIIKQHNKDK